MLFFIEPCTFIKTYLLIAYDLANTVLGSKGVLVKSQSIFLKTSYNDSELAAPMNSHSLMNKQNCYCFYCLDKLNVSILQTCSFYGQRYPCCQWWLKERMLRTIFHF